MYFVGFVARNLTRRPVRTGLTVLGLSVAVAAMVALLGISDNVTRSVDETFRHRGLDLIIREAGKIDQLSSDIDEGLVGRIRGLDGVEGANGSMLSLIEMPRGTASVSVLAQGWAHDNFTYDTLNVRSGRRLVKGDTAVAMLGTTIAETLNKGVGDTIQLQDEPFQVVGVYESDVFEAGSVIIPLPEMQRLSGRPGRLTGLGVRVKKASPESVAEVEAVKRAITGLAGPDGKPYRLVVETRPEYLKTASHLTLTRSMAWMVSAIAILIGVISMLNTMVMSVLERTHEIGILRAVGWPRGRVVRMVLGEAALLAAAAAAVGIVGAVGITYGLGRMPQVNGFIEGRVSPTAVAQGVVITLLIGLVGGLYPAVRAARLLPTEALRHE